MTPPRTLLLLALTGAASLAPLSAQNILTNGDFEKGKASWAIFAPPDAKLCDPKLEVVDGGREGGLAGELSCSSPTRFAITNYVKKGSFAPNQRMRVSAWAKAGEGFQPVPKTPGFAVRVTMFAEGAGEGGMAPAQEGAFYLGLNGVTVRGADPSPMNDQVVPTEWTKIEGVFEVSPDATAMNVAIFMWKASGKLLVDDVVLENVEESVPLSPSAK